MSNSFRKKLISLLTAGTFLYSLIGCTHAMTFYSKDQVESVELISAQGGQHKVLFRPMLESLYFCPGAIVQETSTNQEVRLVRCSISQDCKVDIPAERLQDGSLSISLKASQKPVKLVWD